MKDVIETIARLSRQIVRMEDSAREQFNFKELTLTQMHYLETIRQLGNPNLTELARVMGLSKPTVTVAIDKLLEKEYVIKVQSDEDRRSTHLHLTEKGKLINQMHDYAHHRMAERLTRALTAEELKLLVTLLDKVTS